jgi:gliding motility-associated-like protein
MQHKRSILFLLLFGIGIFSNVTAKTVVNDDFIPKVNSNEVELSFKNVNKYFTATPTVNELITKNLNPTITGSNGLNTTQPAGETLTVTVNGATYTVSPDNSGRWSVNTATDVVSGGTLGGFIDGQYNVVATVTDLSNATTTDITTNELTIDTIRPDFPQVDFLVTPDNTPLITGTWDHIDGVYIQVNVNGTVYKLGQNAELTIDGSGNWTVDLSALTLADGEYNIEVLTRDAAGNNRTDTTRGELIVDTTSPTVVISNAAIAVNNTSSFTITIEFDEAVTGLSISDIQAVNAGKNNFAPINGSTYTVEITPTGGGDITINLAAGAAADVVGNLNLVASEVVVIYDITPPVTPIVNELVTNNLSPILSGSNGLGASQPADETVSLGVNGATYVLVPAVDGAWLIDLSSATVVTGTLGTFVDGNIYEVEVVISDQAGNVSADVSIDELVIDTTSPIIPTITFLTTNDGTPKITGTGEALSTINALINSVSFQSTINGSGNWSINTEIAVPSSGGPFTVLADNTYEIVVVSTDAAGNSSSDNTTNELTVDATGPTSPMVDIIYSNATVPTVTGNNGLGTLQPGTETLTVSLNGATFEPIPDAAGLWSIATGTDTPSSGTLGIFTEGVYDILASVVDGASNTAIDGTSNELTIDLTVPSVPVIDILLTNDQTPVITGSGETGTTISLTVNSNIFDVNVKTSGVWTVNTGTLLATSGGPFTDLIDGVYEINAISTDFAGNTSTDASIDELTIDITIPTAPTVDVLATNDNTPEISGTNGLGTSLPAGEILTVTVGGATYTVTPDAGGIWAINTATAIPSSGVLGVFNDGTYQIVAKISDGAGNNASDFTTNELRIDTTPPTIPTIDFLTTNNPRPVLTGSADIGSTVYITVNSIVFETIADVRGKWTVLTDTDVPSASGPFTDLSDGVYNVNVRSVDEVGNVTFDDTSNQLDVDTALPEIPTANLLTTNDPNPILMGTAEASSKVVVIITGVSFKTTANGSGNWSLNTETDVPIQGGPFANLIDGTYDLAVESTDAAGNSEIDITADELIIDITPPNQPTIAIVLTNEILPILTGTNGALTALAVDENLSISVNGASYTVIPNTGGVWNLDLATQTPSSGALALFDEGTYDVVAQLVDNAGNMNLDNTVNELTIDLTAPTIPTIAIQITNDVSPIMTGSAEAGSILTMILNSVSFEIVAEPTGNWSIDTETAIAIAGGPFIDLIEGDYDIQLSSRDEAGNESFDNTIDELLIDTSPPIIPTIAELATNNSAPTISGFAEINSALTITINGITYELVNNATAAWSLDLAVTSPVAGGPFSPLADGRYDIVLASSDAAGNTSSDATIEELEIDTESPAVPTVVFVTNNDGLPSLSGSWDESDAISLIIAVASNTYTLGADSELTTDGFGNWTLDLSGLTTPLADDTYDIVVTTLDAVGNSAADTTMNELLVNKVIIAVPTVNNITSRNGLPIITGSWDEVNADVLSVTVNTITYILGNDSQLTTSGNGVWELDLSNLVTPLIDGTYEVNATTANNVTTVSDDTTDELLVDILVIATPEVNIVISTDGLPLITGTWDEVNANELTVGVNTVSYSLGLDSELSTDGNGVWQLDLSALAIPLNEGVYDVEVVTAKGTIIESDQTVDELTVAIPQMNIPTVNTLESIDGLPIMTGTWDEAIAISLRTTLDGTIYELGTQVELTSDGSGNWTLDLSGMVEPLPSGTYNMLASATDTGGNTVTDDTTDELVVNIAVLAIPTVNNLSSDDGLPVLSGSWDHINALNLSVEINANRYTLSESTELTAELGNWELNLTQIEGPLLNGVYEITATNSNTVLTAVDTTREELIVNNLKQDLDQDNVFDIDEDLNTNGNFDDDDTDGDNIPNYLDTDDDNDQVPTIEEDYDNDGNPQNEDTDGDIIPDYLDFDDDGDGLTTLEEDVDQNGDPRNDDTDGDSIPDYLDPINDVTSKADLAISMVVSVGPYLLDQSVTYTVIVTNIGPDIATDVLVTDRLATSFGFSSAETSRGIYNELNGSWPLGELAVGRTDTLSLSLQLVEKGLIENTASVEGNELDENVENNEVLISIEVDENFEVGKGFSPNGDGINDTWKIAGIDLFLNNTVKVFNRWGNEVFSTKGYDNNSNNWDGTNQGSLSSANGRVPEGTYFYVIELEAGLSKMTGYLTIKN